MITKEDVIKQLEELGFVEWDESNPTFSYQLTINSPIVFYLSAKGFWKFAWRYDDLCRWSNSLGTWLETDITDIAQLIVLYSGGANEKG